MKSIFDAIQISDRVYWVGAIDWNMRDFHGYLTGHGTTYNAFLIKGQQPILIDTVREPFFDEMMSRVASVVDPSTIKTVVSHHAEMDHSGCLPKVFDILKPERLLTSKAAVDALAKHFGWDVPIQAVKSGQTVQIDDIALTFFDTRMMHWPESMVSYLDGDDVIFSQDAFGMHLASLERYTDEVAQDIVDYETKKYFANILMPYGGPISKVIESLGPVLRKAKVIATDHGPLWRQGTDKLLSNYQTWCERKPEKKLVITYASMWKSTDKMARAIAEGASEAGVQVSLLCLANAHRSDVATELLDAAAWAVGTPCLNGQVFPTIADVMTYMEGLKPKGLIGASFGSYGWTRSAQNDVKTRLEAMKVNVVGDPLTVQYVPSQHDLSACKQLGQKIAEQIRQSM